MGSFLRDRHVLLVLDNCEGVLEGAAALAQELLAAAPKLKILATSREPLESKGEALWRVTPLELPSMPFTELSTDELASFAAVRLFFDRAHSVDPDFQFQEQSTVRVARICALLDGIPLAIELAAARVRTMTLAEIESGLDDRFALLVGRSEMAPPRQRALEATFDRSYELLDSDEQELFARLSTFRDTFPLRGAEVVCGGEGIEPDKVAELMGHLVDKSLVVRKEHAGETWYYLLYSLRRYAYEKIFHHSQWAAMNRQGFLIGLALRTDARVRGPAKQMWSALLEGEPGSVRATLELAYDSFQEDQGSFLAGVAAASATRTGRLGFITGISPVPSETSSKELVPVAKSMANHRNGFIAGVRHLDRGLEMNEISLTEQDDLVYAFLDPSRGYEAACELYAQGCDVVAHAAGLSGNRIFEAARRFTKSSNIHCWGIGADEDQYLIQPESLKPHVLASILKQVPIDVFLAIKGAVIRGEPERAPQFDLSNGGIRLSTRGGHLDEAEAMLQELRQQIISGQIDLSERITSP